MCYPKPGPRCSAHAALKVAEAQKAVFIATRSENKTFKDVEPLMKKLEKAREEYNLTPAGLKAIETYLAERPDDSHAQYKLSYYKELREKKLAALTEDKKSERVHRQVKNITDYQTTELSKNGDVLKEKPIAHPDIQNMINHSLHWAQQLTDEEIVAVRGYTQADYNDVNGMLSNPNYAARNFSREKTQKTVELLDSALAKLDVEKDVVVYRRHFFYHPDGSFNRIGIEEQRKQFTVGSTYKPNFYLSTSLNPDNAPPDNHAVAFLEIKAKKAVPLGVIASQSLNEQEFLLRRDAEYRVVSNTNQVVVDSRSGTPRTVYVIQLEEL